MNWQPIDTAPKDGTAIDMWGIDSREGRMRRFPDCIYLGGKWMQLEGWCIEDRAIDAIYVRISSTVKLLYWMPLPEPPKS